MNKTQLRYKLFGLIKKCKTKILQQDKISKNPILLELFKNIYDNFECIDLLIQTKKVNQAKIILRSNIEYSLIYLYLLLCPEKQNKYIQEKELLKFKYEYSILKQYSDCNVSVSEEIIKNIFCISLEEFKKLYAKRIENYFNQILCLENQQKILSYLETDKFELTDKTDKKFSKFFINYLKDFRFEPICKVLNEKGINIQGISIREILFLAYDTYSQVVHGFFTYSDSDLFYILVNCNRINNLMMMFSIEDKVFNSISEQQIEIKNTLDKLYLEKINSVTFKQNS